MRGRNHSLVGFAEAARGTEEPPRAPHVFRLPDGLIAEGSWELTDLNETGERAEIEQPAHQEPTDAGQIDGDFIDLNDLEDLMQLDGLEELEELREAADVQKEFDP